MGCNGSINAWDKTERTTVPPYRSSLVYQKPARLSRLVDQWLFGDDFLRRPFHGVLLSLRVYLNTLIRSFGTTLSFLHLSNLHKRGRCGSTVISLGSRSGPTDGFEVPLLRSPSERHVVMLMFPGHAKLCIAGTRST